MHLVASAIVTRRTSRHIIAESYFGSVRMGVQHQFNNATQHAHAAAQLVRKLALEWKERADKANPQRAPLDAINSPWSGQWIGGDNVKGDGYCFTYAGETNRTSGIEPRGFVQNCETEFGK